MKVILHKDQRGIGVVEVIIILLVVLGIAAAAYFVITKNKSDSPPQSEASKQVQSECQNHYDDADFCRFVSNWNFGGEQKLTIADGTSVTTIETDSNGNSRMTVTEDGAETTATITIGNSTYIKDSESGNWTKYTRESTDTDAEDENSDLTESISQEFDFDSEIKDDTIKIHKDGKEKCGDLTCFKYTITDTDSPQSSTIMLFDDNEYKLRRVVSVDSGSTSTMEFAYEVAPITEPSPVVEAPNLNNVEGMSPEELQKLMEQYAQ